MYPNIKSTDKCGILVAQLKVLGDDFRHHRAVGESIDDIHVDYPNLQGLVQECLLTQGKLNVSNVERLERVGFVVVYPKGDDKITIHFTHGKVSFPTTSDKSIKCVTRKLNKRQYPQWEPRFAAASELG